MRTKEERQADRARRQAEQAQRKAERQAAEAKRKAERQAAWAATQERLRKWAAEQAERTRKAREAAAAEEKRRANLQRELQEQARQERLKKEAAQAAAQAAKDKREAAAAAKAKADRQKQQQQDALDATGQGDRIATEGYALDIPTKEEFKKLTPKEIAGDPIDFSDKIDDTGWKKPTTEGYALDIPTEEEFKKLTPEEIAGDPIDFSDKIDDIKDVAPDGVDNNPYVLTPPGIKETDFTDKIIGVDAPIEIGVGELNPFAGAHEGKDEDHDPGPKPKPPVPTPSPTPTPEPTPEPPPDYTDRNLDYIGKYSALANLRGSRGSAARNALRQMKIDAGTDMINQSLSGTLATPTPGDDLSTDKKYQSRNVLSLIQKYTSPADIIKSLNEWQSSQSNL